jgi:hypothetical protein
MIKFIREYKSMICDTCDKDIPESPWKKQCLECFKAKYKNCMLCSKKKKNKYLFCYTCNSNKKKECQMTLQEMAENDLYYAYNQNMSYSTKLCKGCYQIDIPACLKWKDYCSNCWFFYN